MANRYRKANNKYLSDYNSLEPSKYIMYLDANNLYGWAMSQDLPIGNFRWRKVAENLDEILESPLIESSFIKCDLEYPKELHSSDSDFPLAPEKNVAKSEWLSEYCKNLKEKFNSSKDHVSKLLVTLFDKEKYVVHGRVLKLYERLGLKIKKIHRILQFDSSPWLKEYIDFNTSKRTQAKQSFEKDFFKLVNNSVFGKTMENLRKRVNLKLTHKDLFVKCFQTNIYKRRKL